MIVAKLKDAADYRGIHPMLDKALEYLNDEFMNTVGTEATHMEGNDLYATLNLFETQPDEKGFFEAHQKYLDIQTPDDAASKPENDFYAFTDKNPAHQSIILRHGDFLVAFPQDAHRVKGQVSGPSDVRKVVFKIRIA